MKIIALDSSGLVASAAIVQDGELVGEYTINHKKTHSQTLLPMLEELKDMTELELDTVDAIAVAGGPGSFTGLRIGSATAKGLAWTMDVPVISVPTTDAMAYHFYGSDKLICPIMDARRSQVYCGIYTFERAQDGQMAPWQGGRVAYRLKVIQDACAVAVEDLIQRLNEMQKEVIFLGDGVPVYQDAIIERTTIPFSFAPPHCNRQRAANVAVLGAVYFAEGKIQRAAEHAPEYLRLSQAERERMEAEQGAMKSC
ncbi:MAG: tRNA (adenosine(37)-N6)-threonylcarbamoyltransferase complex dimerization subunit type 1 TsaB [Lachnospiraceae bacterium]|nr:tRNA (adenosine(37)-N6)-threonylcarbamoyltransferase complex dimerization subunit type 1 TsaB [Lachnospiraceae bacterium]